MKSFSGAQWALTVAALLVSAALCPRSNAAGPAAEARALFEQKCAVCHGADRGGYIGPALNKEALQRLSEGQVQAKIINGGVGTLMPSWRRELSRNEARSLAALVKRRSKDDVSWSMADIRDSLRVHEDAGALPAEPSFSIEDMDDLMAVTARGRYAAGERSKVVFFNGRTHERVGEIPTRHAPHLVDFHPTNGRLAYVLTDAGYLLQVDLYAVRALRSVRVGLNSASLAVSRDGRYVAAGSFVPHSAVILNVQTLEPLKVLELRGVDPDGNEVQSDSGMITSTPFDTSWWTSSEPGRARPRFNSSTRKSLK